MVVKLIKSGIIFCILELNLKTKTMDNNLREFLKLKYQAIGRDRRDKIEEYKVNFNNNIKDIDVSSSTYEEALKLFELEKSKLESEISKIQKWFDYLEQRENRFEGIETEIQFESYMNSI